MSHELKSNGLVVPDDFPVGAYESVYRAIESKKAAHLLYEHYAGAWTALAYRFRAAMDYGEYFVALLKKHGATPPPEERYLQERALFDLYSSGFAAFECAFYGLYTVGAFISPREFPLTTPREQQQVSPSRTKVAFARAFPGDPILAVFAALFADPQYQQWREIRNVLTHRTAPGRRIYVSIGDDDEPPTEWKLNNSPLDESLASTGRRELSRLLGELLAGSATFVAAEIT